MAGLVPAMNDLFRGMASCECARSAGGHHV